MFSTAGETFLANIQWFCVEIPPPKKNTKKNPKNMRDCPTLHLDTN